MVINEKILGMCRTAIRHRLGGLHDVPEELANTVVNIFYKAFRLSMEWAESNRNNKHSGAVSPSNGRGLESDEFLDSIANVRLYYSKISKERKIISEMTETFQKMEKTVELIKELRKIDKSKDKREYKEKVEYILDLMKYGIEDAENKSTAERMIERNLRKKKVEEIAGLYWNL